MPTGGVDDESDGESPRRLADGGGESAQLPDEEPSDEASDQPAETAGAGETDQSSPLTRRRAIAGGGVVVLLGLGAVSANVLRPARAVSPEVPATALQNDDWVRVDRLQEPVLQDSIGPVSLEAIASTLRYENQGLVADIKNSDVEIRFRDETTTERLGNHVGTHFDQSMGVYVATKIDITPHIDELPAGIGRPLVMERVETQAKTQFEDQLRQAGLENVRQVATTVDFEPESGQSVSFVEDRGAFAFEPMSTTIRDVPVRLDGGALDIAGYLGVWHDGRDVIIAAGAHPNQNYTDSVTETAAGQDLTASIDLGLRPSSLREELLGYMAQVA